jgi:hypothetical protein
MQLLVCVLCALSIACHYPNPNPTLSLFRDSIWRVCVFADELLAEKEKYKGISEDLDQTFAELAGF